MVDSLKEEHDQLQQDKKKLTEEIAVLEKKKAKSLSHNISYNVFVGQ